MPIGQQTPTRVVPANGLSAGWPFCSRPDPDGRWSVWLVAVSTGTAGRGGGRREGGGERQTTRPEGERFSWPVTPVTVLPFSFSSLSAGAMTAFLCQFAICFTCNDSVSFLYSEVEGWTVWATAHADLSPYFYLYFPNVLEKKKSHLSRSSVAYAVISEVFRNNLSCWTRTRTKIRGRLKMLENALKCSNEYFRHKGPLSQPAFAWLSPPNSPFKVKWWGLS